MIRNECRRSDGVAVVPVPDSRGADAAPARPPTASRREPRFRGVTTSALGYGDAVQRLAASDGDVLPVAEIVDAAWRRRPMAIMRGWHARRPVTGPMRRWWSPIGDRLVALVDRIALWQERAESRHLLLTMDDRTLRDIGVDRATARYVGDLPFWRE